MFYTQTSLPTIFFCFQRFVIKAVTEPKHTKMPTFDWPVSRTLEKATKARITPKDALFCHSVRIKVLEKGHQNSSVARLGYLFYCVQLAAQLASFVLALEAKIEAKTFPPLRSSGACTKKKTMENLS